MCLAVQLARQAFVAEPRSIVEACGRYGLTTLNSQYPSTEETISLNTGVRLALRAFSVVYYDFSRSKPKSV